MERLHGNHDTPKRKSISRPREAAIADPITDAPVPTRSRPASEPPSPGPPAAWLSVRSQGPLPLPSARP